MAGQKRALDDTTASRKPKKLKSLPQPNPESLTQTAEEVDFPRGGGTSFTPLEVKNIRAEATKEADELFKVQDLKAKKRKRQSEAKSTSTKIEKDALRIEHLNYKRLSPGMKLFGQIAAIEPLALIVSLPNQLYGHIPITNISLTFTQLLEGELEAEGEEEASEEEEAPKGPKIQAPDLGKIFSLGQYVRAIVTAVYAPGSTMVSHLGKIRDEVAKTSRRVELSLAPEKVNAGVLKADLKQGFTLSASIKSIEDHGYALDFGLNDTTGFLSFKHAERGASEEHDRLSVGQVLDVSITKVTAGGRTCHVTVDPTALSSSVLSEVSNASSILPGTLVQSLVTATQPTGLNLQILGFFEGTIDQVHLGAGGASEGLPKVGKKIKARVLYSYSTSPPRFALALSEQLLTLKGSVTSLREAYPIGTTVEDAQVIRVESDQGIVVKLSHGISGVVHISQLSDDHVPSITSSGPWKVGTLHRARVIGYHPFDGLLQLSMKPSVLQQKFLELGEIQVGEVLKGAIKKLTDSALFVSISSNIDGVIWPSHYADIALKHPAKRFKAGANIKCRVLAIDPERRRVSLTAKKTLVDSNLPILSQFEEAKPGTLTHGVVFKVTPKRIVIEFYNNLKASVPMKETSEVPVANLTEVYPIGRVVKVRITSVSQEDRRIIASIRQASGNASVSANISEIDIGNIVEGNITEVHKDHAVLTLKPSHVKALISLKNLANRRGVLLPTLRSELKGGDHLSELVVVTRNLDQGFVIVANKPKPKAPLLSKNLKSVDDVELGQLVGGRVVRHIPQGSLIKISSRVGGILHPTDALDNYESGVPYPPIDTILKATVIEKDASKKRLILSTRPSKMHPNDAHDVIDREIDDISQLKVGDTVRGFIKSIVDHGVFVGVGRNIDARVQIRELFDEYVKDWKPKFQINQLVKGRITSVNYDTKQVELSFRTGNLTASTCVMLSDLAEGQVVHGTIKRIETYGLFIQIDNSKISGLCHKSQLADNEDADVTAALQGFREGDKVNAVIISIEDKRISFSLKPSFVTEKEDRSSEPDGADKLLGAADGISEAHRQEDADSEGEGDPENSDEDETMDFELDQQPLNYPLPNASTSSTSLVPSLELTGGFKWTGNSNPDDNAAGYDTSEDDTGSEVEEGQRKKRKRRKKEIQQDLTADLHIKVPESNADFERLLLGSPNSSYLWIQYMSFLLQLSEIQKARDIARRACSTIDFREEQERLNVWIALLNLENVYGTPETLESTFKEAARANDSKTVHLRLAAIFDQSSAPEKAEEQYKRTCKKFGHSSKVWTLFGEHYLNQGKLEEARKLLPRCLQGLEKHKHLKTISKFAQLEYKQGEPERGRTLFEGIIDSHPKRWDLWSVYIDMEAGQGDVQSIRNLFDRVLALKMTSHKAKAFFKKWLELERRLGDEEGANIVKQKAIEWTQRASSS